MGIEGDPVIHRVVATVGELEDVDVIRVSLVDRGANRVPFRFTKRDSQEGDGVAGFDLGGFLRRKEVVAKAEPAELVGVAFSAEVDADAAKALVEKAGLSTETLIEAKDGGKVYAQAEGDFNPEGLTFMQLNNDWGVFLKGADKIVKQARETLSFKDNLGSAQFIPGLFLSMDTLSSTVLGILDEADSRDEAVGAIKDATSSFGDFVGSLAEQIPTDVFKLEEILSESGETQPGDDASGSTSTADKGDSGTAAKKAEDGDGKSAEDKGKGADDVKKGEDKKTQTADDAGEAKKSESGNDGEEENPVLDAIKALSGKLDGIEKTVKDLDGKVDAVAKTADEAKDLAKKADKALEETVGGPVPGDAALRRRFTRTQKRDGGRVPLMDTSRGGSGD